MVERVGGGEQEMEMEDVDLCGDLFDHIDDLLDFPADHDLVLDGFGGGGCRPSNLLWTEPLLPAPSESGFSGPDSCLSAAGLSVPTEDIPELEWLSSFVEDSFSAGSFGLEEAEEDRSRHRDSGFRTASPVSVLDSTSSSAPAKPVASLLSPHIVVPARARSKRPRPAKFSPRLPLTLVSPSSSSDETDPIAPLLPALVNCTEFSAELDNFAESQPWKKMAKSKKKRPPQLPGAAFDSLVQPVRKCMHCQIQKTPQWRAGPMGPKTLCNACGVRYKSGRLYPEYRPAASPTFIPSVHSNSHKKVLEMRTKIGQKDPAPVPYFVRKTSPISSTNNKLAIDHDMED